MQLRHSAFLAAGALVGIMLLVPIAAAGSGDAQAIRTAAANYKVAALNGSAKACSMLTPNGEQTVLAFAQMDAKTTTTSCPKAVKALAKFYSSKSSSRQAYLHSGALKLKAIARGKVKIDGARATLDYSIVEQGAREFLSFDLALMHGRWLIDGSTDSYG